MTPEPTPTPSPLFDDLLALLPPLREMQQRHQEQLDRYRDADGEPIWEKIADYEEARRETAIEASDHLDTLVPRLEQLVADPPLRAHTVLVSSSSHAVEDDWRLFIVNATDVPDAVRVLQTLPSYQGWLREEYPLGHYGVDPQVSLERSYAGAGPSNAGTDLRDEQARLVSVRPAPRSRPSAPPPNPPPSTPGRSR
ncbi:hypothetical protein ACIO3O_08295 [Streptomyces sp. NPDC087440]|uniref:hypothetical protein n=1 Tax=Streptomyces sp. NPDC087440 TaxID=3365790 RepID=UPI00380215B7